jgi:hypothetical protein
LGSSVLESRFLWVIIHRKRSPQKNKSLIPKLLILTKEGIKVTLKAALQII